jgi:translation initiation factor IF-3
VRCRQDLKELKFRPSTDVHDYQVRLRAAQKFIAKVRPLVQYCRSFQGPGAMLEKVGLFGVLHVAEIIFKVVNALQGDKVKLTLTFKGREMQFQEIGKDLFKVRF